MGELYPPRFLSGVNLMAAIKIKLKQIVVSPDRGRKTFTRIIELSESIKKFGFISPMVVAPINGTDDKYILIAGERRYRASVLAGLSEVPVTLREDRESESLRAEIELEENVCREDITFEEEGNILRKIQDLKKKENPNWGLTQTAEMTNRSIGDVSSKIAIAREFNERPDIKKLCTGLPYTAALKKIKQIKDAEKVQRLSDQGRLTLSTDLLHGNCLDLIKELENNSIDLIITDPPYGLQKLEALRKSGSKKMPGHQLMSEYHNQSIETVCELLSRLAPELARVLKPACHFYIFSGFQYIGNFIEALQPHLEFQPPILIWDRGKPSSPGYGYNYLSKAEAIIYGCCPPKGRRLNEIMYNIFECKDVPSNQRVYPTEKPIPLLQTLIKNSSSVNDLILDPFAGSGSTLRAARATGRRAVGFEIDKQSFLLAQKNLADDLQS
jgi:site-specific DNA-methyltransferase (adenine-specific)